ncbi:MAG: RND family efflux transporter MFP subunit [Arenicella sp.]|jgi:RND family efflux transporter MFP subunit
MSSDYDLNLDDDSKQARAGNMASRLFYLIPRKWRIILCILLIAFVIITLLNAFKPEAKKRPIPETVVRVEVITAQPSDYPIVVNANGTVEAQTRGDLVAQIRGEIVAVASNFNTGGTFKKGDVLIQIDQRDYQAELSGALANLSEAEATYRQEQATAKQAELDWQRLGNTTPAPSLVLRKPQLTAAKARYDSAKAGADSAQLNLSRTQITAPYDGRVIQRKAVLGQYVGIGAPIAEVFATNGVEVRLPISQEEFSQLGLDAFKAGSSEASPFSVSITSTVANKSYQWDAKITRTDSTFDINTRQIDVVAEVADPFGIASGQAALKIGQFVSARIQGRTIENVFVIPNKSIREGRYVYAVRDGKLAKQSINILWQDDQNALASDGIENGELVVTTSLNSTLAGASAKFGNDDEPNKPEDSKAKPAAASVVDTKTESSVTEPADEKIIPDDSADPSMSQASEPGETAEQAAAVIDNAQAVIDNAQAVIDNAQAVTSGAQAVTSGAQAANEELQAEQAKLEAGAVQSTQSSSTK